MKLHNKGRLSVRRGRAPKIEGLDAYINQMFRADEDGALKDYASTASMRADQNQMATDIQNVLPQVIHDMLEDGRDAAREMGDAFNDFIADVEEATPWHADGPTDPPLHAAESWQGSFEANDKNGFTLKLYNPKDYIPFLEAGWSPQAPAGWIAALWARFIARIRNA